MENVITHKYCLCMLAQLSEEGEGGTGQEGEERQKEQGVTQSVACPTLDVPEATSIGQSEEGHVRTERTSMQSRLPHNESISPSLQEISGHQHGGACRRV